MNTSPHKHNSNSQCNCHHASTTAVQSLDELEFERGIWQAAIDNDINRLSELIHKSHIHDRDNSGYTGLHYAARSGHLEACQMLLKAGADVNSQTNGGATALHRASMRGQEDIVKLLISYKAMADIRDADGKTALHRAVENMHTSVAMLLLDYNNELKFIKDAKERLPIDLITTDFNCTDLLALLM